MLTPVSCEEAIDWLDGRSERLPGEDLAAREAAGRVLAEALAAPADHPPTAVAAVDGFALSSGATVGASEYNPLAFRVAGPGNGDTDAARPVVSGEALAAGADAVISLLDADLRGAVLDVYGPVAAGDNVIPAGCEARRGDRLFEPGRVLRPMDVALAVETGMETLGVVRQPRVQLVSIRGDGTRDASGAMIRSLVARDGGTVQVPASPAAGTALAHPEGDLGLVVGGTGFGPNDDTVESLVSAGELAFRGVAINPGETVSAGLAGTTPYLLLPGAPLAAWFAYELLAGRFVRRLAGRDPELPYATRRVVLSRKISSGLGRLECCRLRVAGDRAEPIAVADNRTLATAVRADAFVMVPSQSEGFPEGAEITVYLYDPSPEAGSGTLHG